MSLSRGRSIGGLAAIVAILAVAGCGSGSSTGTSTSGASSTGGSATSGSSSSGSAVKLGIIQPYTGDSAYYGTYANQAFTLAMSKFGAKPGGHPVSFVRGDSKCVPTSAVQAGNQVLADSPVALLAPACSGDTLAIAPLLKARSVPACSINVAPTITSEGGGQIVRAAPSDAFTNELFAKYIAAQGVKKIGIIHDTSAYGQANVQTLISSLKKVGVSVVANASYNFDNTDYSGQILKVKSSGADAAYLEGYDLEVGNLVKQAKQLQLNIPYFANTNAGNQTAGKAAGSALNGVRFAGAFLPDASPAAKEFAKTWQQKTNSTANSDNADLYQCASVILKAVSQAGSDVTGDSVLKAMKQVKLTGMPTGTVSFTAQGELTNPPVLVGTWKSGSTKLVKRLSGGE